MGSNRSNLAVIPPRREPHLQGIAVHKRAEHAGHGGVDDARGAVRSRHRPDARSGFGLDQGCAPYRRLVGWLTIG